MSEKNCTVGISPEGICNYACVGDAATSDIRKMLAANYTIRKESTEWCRENLFKLVADDK